MKINNKIVDELICNLTGEEILPLINLIRNRKNVSEFKIAEQLNVTVNQVRNMLYRLQDHSLVTFQRKKDKKKGWYIYYWTLNNPKVKEALIGYKKNQLQEFKLRLAREQKSQFFFCPTGCMRMTMENAMDHDFKCQECGSLLRPLDNQRTIENIKQRIMELEEELSQPIVVEKEKKVGKKKVKKKVAKKVKKAAKKVKKKITKKKVAKKVKKVAKKAKKVKKKVVKKKVKKKVSKIPKKKSKVARILKTVGKRLKKKKK